MIITVDRKYKLKDYTIGKLSINGQYICDTLEDTDRGLKKWWQLQSLKASKIYGKTAIPAGNYNIIINYSTRFKKNLPLIQDVPCFEGIRIHSGNTPEDTLGCILCGKNKEKGKVLDSKVWTNEVIKRIKSALDKGELVTLQIG